ncbi:MAG: cupin domain-containing protein [Alphaproteobacteria bacterium]|nr:cupin domain-containing protein [Alphaproteobacteria bacterium]
MPGDLSAAEVIDLLDLVPHPEGGYFRETYRDLALIQTADGGQRAASTAIYFLLEQGQVSRWHTVDAAETWHWYAGAPLQLSTAPAESGPVVKTQLGGDLAAGHRPQGVVPPGTWQQAQSLGAWSLVGCTVAPGFTFDGFVLAAEGFEPGS